MTYPTNYSYIHTFICKMFMFVLILVLFSIAIFSSVKAPLWVMGMLIVW